MEENRTFHHFSHQHPLESTLSPSNTTGNITCYGCNLTIFSVKDYYDCKTCSFSLHRICCNMPRKTTHPAHPNHYLTLLISPQPPNSTSKCKACGKNVSGFYYNCAECGIYYHILCSALPLSIAISSHPHTLKIEFSPPYDFCCDLCYKPSEIGWLYRCRFCEFDAHISCAIANQRAKPMPLENTLTRQIIYSSASIMETNRLIDYGVESNELMQLVIQGVASGDQDKNGREVTHTNAVAGWDERLRSPKENNGGIDHFRLHQADLYMSSICTSIKDPSTPISEDLIIPSYQFSDFCFSIDLLKSSSSQDQINQTKKEASSQEMEKVFPEVDTTVILGKTSGDSQQMVQQKKQLDYPNKPVFNPLYRAPENWLNEASLLGGANRYDGKLGRNQEDGKSNGYGGRAGIKEQSIKSNLASSTCLCWRKLSSCCYSLRYQKCSKSFKNGGL